MEIKQITTLEVLEQCISESNNDMFSMALIFNSYFENEKEILVNGLFKSDARAEDIGVINFLSFIINKINLIQEKRNEQEE